MTLIRLLTATLRLLISVATVSAQPVVYEGTRGPGLGKHIVLLAGDHEYRSEETLPALARILAWHHGFKCTVLFNVDMETGVIVPGNSNMPGMEALDTADLAVVFLRFQNFPREQMQHFDDYLNRGGPVIGLRTATHAFQNEGQRSLSEVFLRLQGERLGFVGPFKPNTYGNGSYARDTKPDAYAGFESPIPANQSTKETNPPTRRRPANRRRR